MLILAAVRAEPRYGYAIIETLRLRSSGVFDGRAAGEPVEMAPPAPPAPPEPVGAGAGAASGGGNGGAMPGPAPAASG